MASEREFPCQRLSLDAPGGSRCPARAGSGHRRGVARRGPAAGTDRGSPGPDPRGVADPVQQRVHRGPRGAVAGHAPHRDDARGGCDPGGGPAAPGPGPHTGGSALLRWAEVAAVALGQRLRLRAEGIDRAARPGDHRVDGLRGDRRLLAADDVQPVAQARCEAVRADHPAVPGLRRDERLAGIAARRSGSIGSPAHLREIQAPVLDWARRRGVRVTSPVDHHGSGIVCIAPEDPAAVHQALRQAG